MRSLVTLGEQCVFYSLLHGNMFLVGTALVLTYLGHQSSAFHVLLFPTARHSHSATICFTGVNCSCRTESWTVWIYHVTLIELFAFAFVERRGQVVLYIPKDEAPHPGQAHEEVRDQSCGASLYDAGPGCHTYAHAFQFPQSLTTQTHSSFKILLQ